MPADQQSSKPARNMQPPLIPLQPIRPDIPASIGKTRVASMTPFTIVGPANGFVSTYDGVINPYSGCSFGCSYCYAANFARDKSEQQEWGQWVKVKTNAIEKIKQIAAGSLNNRVYYISTVTDPYQPVEKKVNITRGILEVIAERHPQARIVIQTRSPLVARDTDLFRRIADQGGRVQVNMTITTDDDETRRNYEPGCPSIPARMKAITAVQSAGVQSCITLTPLLPVTDVPSFIKSLKDSGVTRFIVQDFHLPDNGRHRFIARTDARAIESTARHFQCPKRDATRMYKAHYAANLAILRKEIPNIGEGRKGFAPPF